MNRLAPTSAGDLPYWQNKAARDYAAYSGKAVRGRALWDTIAAVENRLKLPVEEVRLRTGKRLSVRDARLIATKRLLPNLEIPNSWRDGDSGMILAVAIQLCAMSDAEIIAALIDSRGEDEKLRPNPHAEPEPG